MLCSFPVTFMCCGTATSSGASNTRGQTSSWPSRFLKFPPPPLTVYNNFGRKTLPAGSGGVIMEPISHLLIHLTFYVSIIYDSDLRSCKNEKCTETRGRIVRSSPGLFHFRCDALEHPRYDVVSQTWTYSLPGHTGRRGVFIY